MRKRRVVTVIAIVLAAATIGVGIYNVVPPNIL